MSFKITYIKINFKLHKNYFENIATIQGNKTTNPFSLKANWKWLWWPEWWQYLPTQILCGGDKHGTPRKVDCLTTDTRGNHKVHERNVKMKEKVLFFSESLSEGLGLRKQKRHLIILSKWEVLDTFWSRRSVVQYSPSMNCGKQVWFLFFIIKEICLMLADESISNFWIRS